MKWKGRKQSENVEIQTPAQSRAAKTDIEMTERAKSNPRTLVNEPIEYNQDKSPEDRLMSAVSNPGRPRPDVSMKIQQKRANDGKAPVTKDSKFFKHTIKDMK